MGTIKVIYASSTGATEKVAHKIAIKLGTDAINVTEAKPDDYIADLLVLGSSTWGLGDLQDDWANALGVLQGIDLKDKKVALFGLGDQDSYPDTFVNAIGILYQTVTAKGATVIGRWPVDGYRHTESEAVIDDHFVGLALDEDNDSDLTDERIEKWCEMLTAQA